MYCYHPNLTLEKTKAQTKVDVGKTWLKPRPVRLTIDEVTSKGSVEHSDIDFNSTSLMK